MKISMDVNEDLGFRDLFQKLETGMKPVDVLWGWVCIVVYRLKRLQLHQELRDQNPAQVRQVKVKGGTEKSLMITS